MTTKPPSLLSLLLALIPFVAICFSVPLWDHIYPLVLGLPFNLAWLLGSILLTPAFMALAYRIETNRDSKTDGDRS